MNLFEAAAAAAEEGIEKARTGAGEEWIERAVGVIRTLAESCRSFTTDDLRAQMKLGGDLPAEPRAFGSAIREAQRRKLIRALLCGCCGEQNRTRGTKENHGRRMGLWEECSALEPWFDHTKETREESL